MDPDTTSPSGFFAMDPHKLLMKPTSPLLSFRTCVKARGRRAFGLATFCGKGQPSDVVFFIHRILVRARIEGAAGNISPPLYCRPARSAFRVRSHNEGL